MPHFVLSLVTCFRRPYSIQLRARGEISQVQRDHITIPSSVEKATSSSSEPFLFRPSYSRERSQRCRESGVRVSELRLPAGQPRCGCLQLVRQVSYWLRRLHDSGCMFEE